MSKPDMRRLGLLLLIILPALTSRAADAPPFEIVPITASSASETPYRFPQFRGREPAATAINTWLQAVELHTLPGRVGKSAFEAVLPKGDNPVGLTAMDYTVGESNARYASVALTGEWLQAYPQLFEHAYSFDSTSGALIALRDLFTPAGLQHLRTLAATRRVATVSDYLKKLSAQNDEEADDKHFLYEDCLPAIRADKLDDNEMLLSATTLTLKRGSCANHAMLALDDLGALPVTLPLADIAADLSSYGRCLVGLPPSPPSCSRPQAGGLETGVYRGTVGKAATTLVIGRMQGSHIVELGYFYDKYAKWIELSGEQRPDSAYWFHELASEQTGSVDSRIVLRADSAGRLIGNWSSADGKSLPVLLTPNRK